MAGRRADCADGGAPEGQRRASAQALAAARAEGRRQQVELERRLGLAEGRATELEQRSQAAARRSAAMVERTREAEQELARMAGGARSNGHGTPGAARGALYPTG